MKNVKHIAAVAALGIAAGLAAPLAGLARDGGPMGMGMGMGPGAGFDFAALDTDGDGRITEAEFRAHRAAMAASLDANGDNLISAEELAAQMTARMQERIEAMAKARVAAQDLDGDGLLSAAELAMPEGPGRLFAMVDADGDGAVTQTEIDAAKERMHDRRGRPGRGDDDRPMRHGEGRGGHGHGHGGGWFGWGMDPLDDQ